VFKIFWLNVSKISILVKKKPVNLFKMKKFNVLQLLVINNFLLYSETLLKVLKFFALRLLLKKIKEVQRQLGIFQSRFIVSITPLKGKIKR